MGTEEKARELLMKGVEFLKADEPLKALTCFERSFEIARTPLCQSYLGYCIALERGKVKEGISLCEDAISKDPENIVHYVNLSKLYLKAERRREAVESLRKGLSFGKSDEAVMLLEMFGIRKKPVFPFLPRSNWLNKYMGLLLNRVGLRQ